MKTWRLAALAALLLSTGSAWAAYPDRPVRIIVPVAPGGTLDTMARLAAEYLRVHMHGTFLVENKPGANSEIGSSYVSRATPDGYTLLVNSDSLVTVSITSKNGAIHPVEGFTPVSMLISSPNVLVARPDLGAKTIQQFMTLAKAKPLAVASTGAGTGSQFTGMWFKQESGIKWTDVPYNGSGPAVADLLGGHVDAMWSMAASVLPHVKAGKLVPLAVTTKAPTPQLPGVPTVDASVLPNFIVSNWTGLFAPPGTPAAVVASLSKQMSAMMKDPEQVTKVEELGFEPVGSDPATLGKEVRSSLARWTKIAREAELTKGE